MSAIPSAKARPVAGVIVGLLIEIGGSVITAGAVSIAYLYVLARQGSRHRDMVAAFSNPEPASAFFVICMSVLACCCFFGGLVSQRLARASHFKHTLLMALIGVGAGLALTAPIYSWGLSLIMVAVIVCSLFLGARVAGQRD